MIFFFWRHAISLRCVLNYFISECRESGTNNWIVSIWCKFNQVILVYQYVWCSCMWLPQHSNCSFLFSALSAPPPCSYLLHPKRVSEIRLVLVLPLLTIAPVHSGEEQLTNSSIVFVYMSELKANYLINVFCLEQKC